MKYVRLAEDEADRFGKWLESQGFTVERDSEYTRRKNHYFSAWPPERLDMRRIVLHRFHNRKTGEWIGLASVDDAWRAYQCFLNGYTHVTANIRSPYGPNHAPRMKKRISISEYQPQAMREKYPVPFEIPPGISLTIECRLLFNQHPEMFQEWLELYRTANVEKENADAESRSVRHTCSWHCENHSNGYGRTAAVHSETRGRNRAGRRGADYADRPGLCGDVPAIVPVLRTAPGNHTAFQQRGIAEAGG